MTSKKHRFLHPSLNITCYSKLYKMIWPFVKFPCFMLGSLSFMFPCFQHKKDVEKLVVIEVIMKMWKEEEKKKNSHSSLSSLLLSILKGLNSMQTE